MKNILQIVLTFTITYAQLSQFYQENVASQYYEYCKVAKCSLESITNWNCGYYCERHPGMVDVRSFYKKDHHSQAYCGYNTQENLIVLVYRSTEDVVNWINNFKFTKHSFGDCSKCKVHLGFWQTYDDLSTDILECTKDLKQKYPQGEIMIAGHSLGGAIAAMTAVDVTRLGYKVDHFYSYGAPRVGNDEFEEWFMQFVNPTDSWRVTHNQDTVVHLPPRLYGFRHIPQEVWYNKDNSAFTICSSGDKEDPDCSDSVMGTSTDDHSSYFNEHHGCTDNFEEE